MEVMTKPKSRYYLIIDRSKIKFFIISITKRCRLHDRVLPNGIVLVGNKGGKCNDKSRKLGGMLFATEM